jgi:hypothetical protein
MHPDTWDVRRAVKLLSDQALAEELAELYRQNVINNVGDVQDDSLIADQTRDTLFGANYGDHVVLELNETIMALTRPNGLVQEELANHGNPHSLCSTRVRRKLHDSSGVEFIVVKTARFATQDAGLAAMFLLDPQFIRTERMIERSARMMDEHTKRIPALAQYTPGMIRKAHSTINRELPLPKQPPKKLNP